MLETMAIKSPRSTVHPMTSADEFTATVAMFQELGSDHSDAAVESFISRLGDQIDDRVAETFDEQLTERMQQPGPLRSAATRGRAELAFAGATMALGTIASILASDPRIAALAWAGLAVISAAYFSRRR